MPVLIRRIKMNKVILTAAALLLSANTAAAQGSGKSVFQEQFAQIDTNGDGKITAEEFLNFKIEETKKTSPQAFKKIDLNGDGVVTEGEYEQMLNNIMQMLVKTSAGLAKQINNAQ